MSSFLKRKAGSPLSDSAPEAKPQAPGPSSPSLKGKSPTPGPASPGAKEKSPTPGPASPKLKEKASPSSPASPAANETSGFSGARWVQEPHPGGDTNDEDSTLGSDVESSTASVASSILHYRTINGRTYHSESVTDSEYWGPNDEKHMGTLEIYYHASFLMMGEKLHQAPLKDNIEQALDIGTGQGLWAIDFADARPNCEVVGTDISPNQPTWCPPNVRFEIDDATKEWTFKDNFFDYIHISFLSGAITDWDHVYEQAYRVCKPGGWIEHADVSSTVRCDDGTLIPGSALDQYGKLFAEVGRRMGRSMTVPDDGIQEAGIKKAGFVNVTVKEFKLPVSPWPEDPKQKEIGMYCLVSAADVEGAINFLGPTLGWSKEEISAYATRFLAELKEAKQHCYWYWKVVYAQKPENAN